jgi:hypothetical protein
MGASDRVPIAIVVAAIAYGVAACDILLGLGDYTTGPCSSDCGVGDTADKVDAGAADADADVTDDDGPGIPPPTLSQLWARWPMPNPPGAPIGGDSGATLPNPMRYDASVGDDGATPGGGPYVHDLVTGLVWQRTADTSTPDYGSAAVYCNDLPPLGSAPWRVPTRIELVSLLDLLQAPAIDPAAFPGARGGPYWTSSVVRVDAGADAAAVYWVLNFDDGTIDWATKNASNGVRCVNRGSP